MVWNNTVIRREMPPEHLELLSSVWTESWLSNLVRYVALERPRDGAAREAPLEPG